jgi:CII-binding regulator of phage lambda lysogenization HflD
MFSFCLERLKETDNWIEYCEWSKFFLKVRFTNQCAKLRKKARMMAKIGPSLVKKLENLNEKDFQKKLFILEQQISNIFHKIVSLLKELIDNKSILRDPQMSTLETLLKSKKNIIQKSARLSKNFISGINMNQKLLFANLGNLIESEKIIQTCLVLLNISNFRSSFFFNKFLTNFHVMIKLLVTSKGGIPLLFRNPQLSTLIEKSLRLTHNIPINKTSGLFGPLDLSESKQNIYSRLIRDPSSLIDNPQEKDLVNCHNHVFFRGLNDAVTLLISVYGSIYVMSKATDLINTFISLTQFLKSESVHKQAFALVLKEQLVMKLFLTILDVDNNPQLLQKMHREVLLCLQILTQLFQLSTETFYQNHEEIWKTLNLLSSTISKSKDLLSPRNITDLEQAVLDLQTKLKPLTLLNKDLSHFVSFLKEQSRYTQNNIQTLLSNKNTRFDDEREFPEDDLSKRLARLRDDFLPFFGLGQGITLKSSLANLGLLKQVLHYNSSAVQKLVDTDCFSPIVMLIQISTFVLKSLMEGADFSARLISILDYDISTIIFSFFSVLSQATDIALFKLSFKLREESYSKEYENVALFQSFLSIIKIISDFYPNMIFDLIQQTIWETENWAQDRLFPERKNSSFQEINEQTKNLLSFVMERNDSFFDLICQNGKYGHASSRKGDRTIHWK